MLFCNIFWMEDNIVRKSYLIYGHNKEKVHEQARNIFDELREQAFEDWDDEESSWVDMLFEEGVEEYPGIGSLPRHGGVFVEWIDPNNIHLVE